MYIEVPEMNILGFNVVNASCRITVYNGIKAAASLIISKLIGVE